jgi:hypothetical protein
MHLEAPPAAAAAFNLVALIAVQQSALIGFFLLESLHGHHSRRSPLG